MSTGRCLAVPSTCDKVKEIRAWEPSELKAFRELAKWSIPNWPTLYKVFATTSRALAKKGIEIGYDWNRLHEFEARLAATAAQGDFRQASMDMATYLVNSIREHMPELLADPLVARLATELSDSRIQRSALESASNP